MKRSLPLVVLAVALACVAVSAVDFGPLTVGIHIIPAVEAGEGEDRLWDVSLSLGVGLTLDASNRFEVHALTDSQLTSLGMTALYYGRVTDRLTSGVGFMILWPLGAEQELLKPILEAFAHGTGEYTLGPILRGEIGFSVPLLAAAHRMEGWEVIALAELPSLSLAGEFNFEDDAVVRSQLTLQPVITDTTLLKRPIGRISERLLVLPSISGYVRFFP